MTPLARDSCCHKTVPRGTDIPSDFPFFPKHEPPALLRLRQKLDGRSTDIGVLTDYSRMHHRHNRD